MYQYVGFCALVKQPSIISCSAHDQVSDFGVFNPLSSNSRAGRKETNLLDSVNVSTVPEISSEFSRFAHHDSELGVLFDHTLFADDIVHH